MPQTLFTPGPVPVPDNVYQRMSQPAIHHHSSEAKELFRRINERLPTVFQTQQPVLSFSSSSTGAAEAVMCSLFNAGEKAILLNNGRFAKRWASMLKVYGLGVVEKEIEWGKAVQPHDVEEMLHQHPDVVCVWVVHSETSTGVLSDIEEIARTLRRHSNALLCVDAVSSLCVHEVQMDTWGIDILICGSQKGFMLPPGLGFAALSRAAQQKMESCTTPRFYFDVRRALEAYHKNSALFTPAMSLLFGLDGALDLLLSEGMEAVWQRHTQRALLLRAQLETMGYEFFASSPSNALTTVCIPQSCPDIVQQLRQQYGITVAKGQDHLEKVMFRIGHIGIYNQDDMNFLSSALKAIIEE